MAHGVQSAMGGAHEDRIAGTLLGTAVGDALGLPMEGLSARRIARRFPRLDHFMLLGRTGYVSDDTEQSALVAAALVREPEDAARCAKAFRRSLLGWLVRLPWAIGWGRLRACARIAVGLRRSGVRSAGNGAAMRAAVIGARLRGDAMRRARFARALAEVTHTDARAVDGAVFVAELAALAARSDAGADRVAMVRTASTVVAEQHLADAIDQAARLALDGTSAADATRLLGTSGFVVHSVPCAAFFFARHGDDPSAALRAAVAAGGDTDSIAAIVGAWCGALHGTAGLPAQLVARLHDGPFGPTHLRALAHDLAGTSRAPTRYSALAALVRNVLLFPVVLAHGLSRLVPVQRLTRRRRRSTRSWGRARASRPSGSTRRCRAQSLPRR